MRYAAQRGDAVAHGVTRCPATSRGGRLSGEGKSRRSRRRNS
jgi:hypothetical protein